MADLNDNIARQAMQPIASSAGQQSATGRSIDELIRAAQHGAQVAANKLPNRGIAFAKIISQGAAPEPGGVPLDFGRGGI
jgi:hypothetical protein